MPRSFVLLPALPVLVLLTACAASTRHVPSVGDDSMQFSSNALEGGLPQGWEPFIVRPDKNRTDYALARDRVPDDTGTLTDATVLRAVAQSAASGLVMRTKVDPTQTPILRWRWKVVTPIQGADGMQRHLDDYPARIILAFDGDRSTLPVRERVIAEQARLFTGQPLPYATLIYVWDPRHPRERSFRNAYTDRVRTLVAQTGEDGVGAWHVHERDIAADFQAVFGEAPGMLIGVSVMTDSDNTRTHAEALYGDIRLHARAMKP
ncbi:MAG TPA: DUF3047 domain-containing protein [Burkholderiaceae bacterium]|nr:DUF3047 domain-containing protein [Burkholderiaceae bacterium]